MSFYCCVLFLFCSRFTQNLCAHTSSKFISDGLLLKMQLQAKMRSPNDDGVGNSCSLRPQSHSVSVS